MESNAKKWEQLIAAARDSGMTLKTWCQSNGIKEVPSTTGIKD